MTRKERQHSRRSLHKGQPGAPRGCARWLQSSQGTAGGRLCGSSTITQMGLNLALLFLPVCPALGAQVDDPSKYGVIILDEYGRVQQFVEKPKVRWPGLVGGGGGAHTHACCCVVVVCGGGEWHHRSKPIIACLGFECGRLRGMA